MTQPDDALIQRLVAAWQSGTPLAAGEAMALTPASDDAAYAVQRRVGDALGWFPHGRAKAWKIASTPPTAAPVPDAFIQHSPVRFDPSQAHTLVGVEVELVLQLAHDLAPGCTPDEAADAIGGITAAIELFDVRAHDWRTLPARFLLADHQMHCRLILGSGIDGPWQADYAETEVSLLVDGHPILTRRGGHALGTPIAILPWLAGHVARHGAGLKAGDLIASGTWTGLYTAHAGEHIEARFDGIGTVELTLDR